MNPWSPSPNRPHGAAPPVELEGVTFEAPPGWTEESVLSLSRAGKPPKPTLSLHRVGRRENENLDTVVSRRLAELSAVSPVEVVGTREITVAGRRAITMLLRTPAEGVHAAIMQRLLFVATSDATWVLSGASVVAQDQELVAEFERALGSLRLPSP